MLTNLGTLGGPFARGEGINGFGHIVGMSTTADGAAHAYLWRDGAMTNIGDFTAADLNGRDQVVGYSGTLGAIIWEQGVITDLEDFRGACSSAADINGAVQIAGALNIDQGYTRAVRWTPSQ